MMRHSLLTRVYGTFLARAKAFSLALVLAILVAGPALASPATDVIDKFHANLLETMQNAKSWGYQKRRDFLAGPVRDTFNADLMVRLASAGSWNSFTEEEQKQLGEAFYQFTLSNYASRFKGFSGQQFETLSEESMRGKRVMVKTKLINGSDEIFLNYVLYPEGDSYKVIDVWLKGSVSELAIRKSEFSPILRDQGFTGLLTLLKQMVSNLEREAVNPS